jgi:hypothetical protein
MPIAELTASLNENFSRVCRVALSTEPTIVLENNFRFFPYQVGRETGLTQVDVDSSVVCSAKKKDVTLYQRS